MYDINKIRDIELLTAPMVAERLNVSYPTAKMFLMKLELKGLVRATEHKREKRTYSFWEWIDDRGNSVDRHSNNESSG